MLNYSDALLLIIPIYISMLIVGLKAKISLSKHILFFIISCYITLVIAVTLFPLPISKEFIELMRVQTISANNFIPFNSINDLLSNSSVSIILRNILGNIVLLLPFGFFLPCLSKKLNYIRRVFIGSLIFSMIIESSQFIISLILGYSYKVTDIDDLILNVIGGILGYAIFKLCSMIFKLDNSKPKINTNI